MKLVDLESTFQNAVFRAGTLKTTQLKRRDRRAGQKRKPTHGAPAIQNENGKRSSTGWEESR